MSSDLCMGEGSQILFVLGGARRCRLMCGWVRVSSDVRMGEGSQILIVLVGSGRVLSEVSSDVCMGEGSQILICFGRG